MTSPTSLLLLKLLLTLRPVIHTWKPWDLDGLAKTVTSLATHSQSTVGVAIFPWLTKAAATLTNA